VKKAMAARMECRRLSVVLSYAGVNAPLTRQMNRCDITPFTIPLSIGIVYDCVYWFNNAFQLNKSILYC